MIDRFPLFRPAQNKLFPAAVTGQRLRSSPPPIGSKRMTSAPICASVMPPSGAATNADPSTTRMPCKIPSMGLSFPGLRCEGRWRDQATTATNRQSKTAVGGSPSP